MRIHRKHNLKLSHLNFKLLLAGAAASACLGACISASVPPAPYVQQSTSITPPDPAERMMADVRKSMHAPPPAKLIALPADQSTDPQKNIELATRAGTNTTEFWQARGEVGEYGGTMRVSTFGSGPKTFNYWAADDADSGGVGQLIGESLIEIDPWTGKYYPRLLKSFQVSADNKEYTFVLRRGLRWSDGEPIKADDIVFTLNDLIKDGYANPSYRDTLSVDGQFPEVRKVDDLTVRVRTKRPFAPFLSMLVGMPMAPKHCLAEIRKKPRSAFAGFWDINCDPKTIVTSGPFTIERYVPGQRVEFKRNPYFAMVDAKGRRLPYLDHFDFLIVPDQNAMLLKFYAGELDLLDKDAVRGSDAALMKQRERRGDFKMYNLGASDTTTFLIFNMNRRKDSKGKYYVDPIKQKWFNNEYFRHAITHATDRRRIVDNIMRGVGLPLYGPETPGSLYFDQNLKAYQQDLRLAQALLTKGGFIMKQGMLYDADGNRVEFTLQTNAGNSNREGSCVMLANDFAKLGIKVNFQPIDFNVMIDKTATSLDWEALVMSLTGSKTEPYSGANIYKSDGRLHLFDQRLPGKDGVVHVEDARNWELETDTLFNQGATTLDTAKRHEIFDKFQKLYYDKVPFIYLFTGLELTAIQNRIGNYNPTPIGSFWKPKGTLHNVEEIYIKSGIKSGQKK